MFTLAQVGCFDVQSAHTSFSSLSNNALSMENDARTVLVERPVTYQEIMERTARRQMSAPIATAVNRDVICARRMHDDITVIIPTS